MMKIIKWFLSLFRKKKQLKFTELKYDKTDMRQLDSRLSKRLDDICIKHHESLPYEPD